MKLATRVGGFTAAFWFGYKFLNLTSYLRHKFWTSSELASLSSVALLFSVISISTIFFYVKLQFQINLTPVFSNICYSWSLMLPQRPNLYQHLLELVLQIPIPGTLYLRSLRLFSLCFVYVTTVYITALASLFQLFHLTALNCWNSLFPRQEN